MPQAGIHFGRKAPLGVGWWALVVLVFTTENWTSRPLAGQSVDGVRLLKAELLTFLPWVLLSPHRRLFPGLEAGGRSGGMTGT